MKNTRCNQDPDEDQSVSTTSKISTGGTYVITNDDPNFVNQARLVTSSPDFERSIAYENLSRPSTSSCRASHC